MMPRVGPIGDSTLALPLQLTPRVQCPICLFETHVSEALWKADLIRSNLNDLLGEWNFPRLRIGFMRFSWHWTRTTKLIPSFLVGKVPLHTWYALDSKAFRPDPLGHFGASCARLNRFLQLSRGTIRDGANDNRSDGWDMQPLT
jgi:hypothetical protein